MNGSGSKPGEVFESKLKTVLDKIQVIVYDYTSNSSYGTLGIDLNFENGNLKSYDVTPKKHIKL